MVQYNFSPQQHLLNVKFSSYVSYTEIEDFMEEIFTSGISTKSDKIILDFTSSDNTDLDYDTLFLVALEHHKLLHSESNVKMAWVINNGLWFGMGRMFKNLSLPQNLEVSLFEKRNESLEWLGIATAEEVF